MEDFIQNFDRDLNLVRLGYTYAIQDSITEIIKATSPEALGEEIDNKTLLLVDLAIQKAFDNLNEKFEEQTTLRFINTSDHG